MTINWSSIKATAFRLKPNSDLKSELVRIARDHQLQAASVVAAVGSLSKVALRFANRPAATEIEGKHEIVSLSGTLSMDGIHLHMSVANSEGQMLGGHVMNGSIVYTTLEIVVADLSDLAFTREQCPISGFKELIVKPRNNDF